MIACSSLSAVGIPRDNEIAQLQSNVAILHLACSDSDDFSVEIAHLAIFSAEIEETGTCDARRLDIPLQKLFEKKDAGKFQKLAYESLVIARDSLQKNQNLGEKND